MTVAFLIRIKPGDPEENIREDFCDERIQHLQNAQEIKEIYR